MAARSHEILQKAIIVSAPVYSCSGDLSVLPELVSQVILAMEKRPVLFLKGNLGAGKTTFSQSLLAALGVSDQVTSPTFNIVNTYYDTANKAVYHFDLYRIKHPAELDDIGFHEYIDSSRPCLIEWPEIIEGDFQDPHLVLEISHQDTTRHYALFAH